MAEKSFRVLGGRIPDIPPLSIGYDHFLIRDGINGIPHYSPTFGPLRFVKGCVKLVSHAVWRCGLDNSLVKR
jgi:hypothetical protein